MIYYVYKPLTVQCIFFMFNDKAIDKYLIHRLIFFNTHFVCRGETSSYKQRFDTGLVPTQTRSC